MPVTYTFTSPLTGLPASTNWPCMDFTEASMPNIGSIPGPVFSRGAPHVTIDGDNDLVMYSDDAVPTILQIPLPISTKFTFETTFKPVNLPQNLLDLTTSLFFIAVFDTQDNAGGVLLSQSGLAIVSSYGNTVMPIAGSQNILPQSSDYYTMRMVVDGENNVMDLYVTLTSLLPTTGHQLQYTTAAPITPAGTPDKMQIELLGHPTTRVQGNFSTLRCNCSELVIPNLRPIADTGQDQTAVIGSVIKMSGLDSYDPEGEPLTYEWSVYGTPENSRYRISGANGFTVDDGDGDGWTAVFESTVDAWDIISAPDLQPLDVLIVNSVQYVVSTLNWIWNATTLTYDRDVGFDPKKLDVQTEAIPDNLTAQAWEIYHQTTFWSGRTEPQPTFVPDVDGMYALQLVVNDGSLDSLPNQGLVNIADSNVPYGVVPDLNFIWDYLSDAWNLYDDRDPITTMWSGFAQIASNILLTAWQLDYAKSLVDIQRTFQRRWLDYRPLLEEPTEDADDITVNLFRGRILSLDFAGGTVGFGAGADLILSKNGATDVTITLVGTLTATQVAAAINLAFGEQLVTTPTAVVRTEGASEYLSLEYSELLVVRSSGSANTLLGFSTIEDTENKYSGVDGYIYDPFTVFEANVGDPLVNFTQEGFTRKDLLIYGGIGYELEKVAGIRNLTTIQQMTMQQDAQGVDRRDWEMSSYVQAVNTNFTDELVAAGDILILEVWEDGDSQPTEVRCEVTGSRNTRVGFNPAPLYIYLNSIGDEYEVTLKGVLRVNSIAVDSLVQRVPRLQEILLDPDTIWTENRDYTIYENDDGVTGVHFKSGLFSFDNPPPDILWAELTFLNNEQMIEDNFGKAVDLRVENIVSRTDDLDYLSAVRGLWYAFFNGPSLWSVRIGTQILLGLPFAEVKGEITDINATYSATEIRVLVQDSTDDAVTRSYFIPRSTWFEENNLSMIALNPDTQTEYVVGDTIPQFFPLSKGVDILDYIKDPDWFKPYIGQDRFLEVHKLFKFLVQADVDVFNITNLVFAIDFVKKVKPHYTYPFWTLLKRVASTEISVTDDIQFFGTLHLFDNPACGVQIDADGVGGAYRYDDTDESGNYNYAFDGVPAAGSPKPQFLYDKKRLCPAEQLVAIMSGNHTSGSYFPYDWIWAYDDGGGSDPVPLSGPLASQPPQGGPYGALVGNVQYDTIYAAGWYTRAKIL